MQEQVSSSLRQISNMAAPGNTPSLEEVREKIERRYANALGQAELVENSVEGRMLEVQRSTLDVAGRTRMDEIRAGMAGGSGPAALGTSSAPALDKAPTVDPAGTSHQTAQPTGQPATAPSDAERL